MAIMPSALLLSMNSQELILYIYTVLQMRTLQIYGLLSAGKLVLWMPWRQVGFCLQCPHLYHNIYIYIVLYCFTVNRMTVRYREIKLVLI